MSTTATAHLKAYGQTLNCKRRAWPATPQGRHKFRKDYEALIDYGIMRPMAGVFEAVGRVDTDRPVQLKRVLGGGFAVAASIGTIIGLGIMRTPGEIAAVYFAMKKFRRATPN